MNQSTIRLPNRYNEKVELVPDGRDRWRLVTQANHLRFGTDSASGMVNFFDPPGGPLVMLGEVIDGHTVVAIQPTNAGTCVWMLPEDADDFEQRRRGIIDTVKASAPDPAAAPHRFVIGMIGKAGSGKDTVGEYICERHGFQRLALADPLKRGLMEMCGISEEYSNDRSKRDLPIPDMPQWTLRKLWQFVGTELMRRQVDDLIWIKTLIKNCPKEKSVVVTDVRFPNEIDGIRERSGCPVFFVKVTRPGFVGTDVGIQNHASEIHDLEGDFTIVNNGTLEDLYDKVEWVLEEIGKRLDERDG